MSNLCQIIAIQFDADELRDTTALGSNGGVADAEEWVEQENLRC